ncbi:MAG: 16S rRNA (adenine(1518)-N(6)/adenine(1519)-N(6))-dimethyltransferase RsmA [Solirubrobacteraceae bacterium]|jgi:16S rRNA (adenine1518-N6/adenine1519-N6)-dimethyltransferase
MSAVAEGPVQPSAPSDGPVQPSLRRMRRFGVRPDRDLGQNFLIDSNILGVIGRAAALEPSDVVLEVGGGLGVLSEYLAARAAHVHVVEIDERLREALLDATDAHTNVTVHWADAMTLDLAALQPAPGKVVANLPYGVAASVLLRSIEQLPSVSVWVAMVQREVGERLAARSGGGAYGVPSVLAQLACEVEVLRAIPRTVFYPVPNVDSVLVGMRRRTARAGGAGDVGGDAAGAGAEPEGVSPALRALVAGAFAHRRKTLSSSLGLAGGSRSLPPRSREQVREALVRLGHPADVRAERLSPEDFRALARLLEL